MIMIERYQYIVILLFVLTILFTAPHFLEIIFGPSVKVLPEQSTRELEKNDQFSHLALNARAAYVFDARTGDVLFSKNPEEQLPLASLTKIMTALVARESFSDGTLLAVDRQSLEPEGDQGLLVGDIWRLKNIVDLMLVASSNDAARVTASVGNILHEQDVYDGNGDYFIRAMNKKAREIGLMQTYFLNESGLDSTKQVAGAYGSAKDVVSLFNYIIQHHVDFLEATSYSVLHTQSEHSTYDIYNTNVILENIPGVIGSKTGFTDLAGGNLIVAFDAGPIRPIIIAVLGSTEDGRFSDMEKLVQASIRTIEASHSY